MQRFAVRTHIVMGVAGASLVAGMTGFGRALSAQQVADSSFRAKLVAPSYPAGTGPRVLLDEGHSNFHTLSGRYLPFGRVLQQDGYVVAPSAHTVTRAVLDSARVFVIANALAPVNETDWYLPTPSAFTDAEIRTLERWVSDGGSLLLIADHMPFAGAAESLAAAFGIAFANGFALDSTLEHGDMHFRRSDATLASHAITNGEGPGARIDSVTAFTGQAFRLLGPGTPLLTLSPGTVLLMPEEAWLFSKRTPRTAATGLLQGAVLHHGRGRVAVFGEAAMFSAQLGGPTRTPMGMNDPQAAQNPQFLINVMKWLTGQLQDH
ncbi:MAG: hypothetical protein U0163_04325 [Gemmatimonadaceae bacterium]